jgi:hypothetical protein
MKIDARARGQAYSLCPGLSLSLLLDIPLKSSHTLRIIPVFEFFSD